MRCDDTHTYTLYSEDESEENEKERGREEDEENAEEEEENLDGIVKQLSGAFLRSFRSCCKALL